MKAFFKDEGLLKFCQAFDASVEESPKKFYKPITHHVQDFASRANSELPTFQFRTEVVDAVALHIPAYRMNDFIDAINERQVQAIDIRHKYPAVKKAYDNYMLLLKMCGEDNARY